MQYRHQLSKEPIKRTNGRPKVVTEDSLSDIRLDILACVFRNPYITSDQISKTLKVNVTSVRDAMILFYSKNVSFVEISADDIDDYHPTKALHWLITDRGIAHLLLHHRISKGLRRPRAQPLQHEYMITHAMTHMEAGARVCKYATFYHWEQIRTRDFVPQSTANSDNPFAFPCHFEGKKATAHPDAAIFSIALSEPYQRERFIAFEADTGSKNREQMIKQFTKWLDVIHNQVELSHLGVKRGSFFVLFLVRSVDQTDRIAWLKDILLEITEGKGSKAIGFMPYERLGALGYTFTNDWERAGATPINLSK